MRLAGVGVALLAAAALVAAVAQASPRWTTHKQAGFAVAAPAGWIDLVSASPERLAKIEADPKLRHYGDFAKQVQVKLALVSFDAASYAHGYASSVLITVTKGRRLTRADVAAQLKHGHVVGAKVDYVPLPAGRAVRATFERQLKGTPLVLTTTYVLYHDKRDYVIACTTLPSARRHFLPRFAAIVRTFRFTA